MALQKSSLQFLQNLAKHNNKTWFDENRAAYLSAKADFEAFIQTVLDQNEKTIPDAAGKVAKNCIFRIFKDVRFSKDKSPYKTHMGASFGKGDKKVHCAGYYIHLEPGNKSFIGGGIWMPEGTMLKSIRQEIDYNFDTFTSIIQKTSFSKTFGPLHEEEKLVRPPKGYTEDNPAIEYLKLKSFTVGSQINDAEWLSKDIYKKTGSILREMKPFIDFLNQAEG